MTTVFSKLKSTFQDAAFHVRQRYWRSVSPSSTVIRCLFSSPPRSNKLCLFSTYDRQGHIDPYVKEYIRALHACGFDVILISTSQRVEQLDVEDLRSSCRAALHRKNVGLDFGSWKAATELFPDWKSYERLLLANDSVYGPFRGLNKIFDQLELTPELVCGLTDSFELNHHLQSYFLYLKQPWIQSDLFEVFWRSIRIEIDKDALIRAYEVGLSQHALSHGLLIKALFPYHVTLEAMLTLDESYKYYDFIRTHPTNSTLYMWDVLITNFQFPFLKTEILKQNRLGLPNVDQWQEIIPNESSHWRGLIDSHLKRVSRHR